MFEHELSGLDGSSLLGFCSALGVLRLLSEKSEGGERVPRLRWQGRGGVTFAVIEHPTLDSREALLSILIECCCSEEKQIMAQLSALEVTRRELSGRGNEPIPPELVQQISDLKPRARAASIESNRHSAMRSWFAEHGTNSKQKNGEHPKHTAIEWKQLSRRREFQIGVGLTVSDLEFRQFLLSLIDDVTANSRSAADFAAAYGSEVYPRVKKAKADKSQGSDKGDLKEERTIQCSPLDTMPGPKTPHLITAIVGLHLNCTPSNLEETLFGDWMYDDTGGSLRWSASDDRRYALRSDAPNKENVRMQRGANRLACEALPAFPTMISRAMRLGTLAFGYRGGTVEFTWPLWKKALMWDSIRSLIGLPDLQKDDVPILTLRARGITHVYRAQKKMEGYFPTFQPAREVM